MPKQRSPAGSIVARVRPPHGKDARNAAGFGWLAGLRRLQPPTGIGVEFSAVSDRSSTLSFGKMAHCILYRKTVYSSVCHLTKGSQSASGAHMFARAKALGRLCGTELTFSSAPLLPGIKALSAALFSCCAKTAKDSQLSSDSFAQRFCTRVGYTDSMGILCQVVNTSLSMASSRPP